MKKLIILSMIILVSSYPMSQALKKPISIRDTLIISAPIRFTPFMYLNTEGNPAGMFADMWRLWAQKTGQKIGFHLAPWKDTLESLKNGSADIHGMMYDRILELAGKGSNHDRT